MLSSSKFRFVRQLTFSSRVKLKMAKFGPCRERCIAVLMCFIDHCVNLYSASLMDHPNAHSVQVPCRQKCCFCKHTNAVSVAFGFRTWSGRLVQVDGSAMAKGRRPYVLSRWRGSLIGTAMSLAGQWDTVNSEVLRCPTVQASWLPAWTLLSLRRQANGARRVAVHDRTCLTCFRIMRTSSMCSNWEMPANTICLHYWQTIIISNSIYD